MDVDAVLEQLATALRLQYRSALEFTLVAGSLSGFQYAALTDHIWSFAEHELRAARHIVEKIVALGGEPPTETEPFQWLPDPDKGFDTLIEHEEAAIDALQDVIPNTGNDGPSEALEHRMEHLIMRKQEQVDFLIRASGKAG